MTAAELFEAYISSIRVPAAAAALFADDGVIELPYINSSVQGRQAIQAFLEGLLVQIPDFKLQSVQMLINTPDQAFAEYHLDAVVQHTGRQYKQHYFGRLVARDGKIILLREALNTHIAFAAFGVDPSSIVPAGH